jgi:hypothetical protein
MSLVCILVCVLSKDVMGDRQERQRQGNAAWALARRDQAGGYSNMSQTRQATGHVQNSRCRGTLRWTGCGAEVAGAVIHYDSA